MSGQIAIPGTGPTFDRSLSQWHTDPRTAARMAAWLAEDLSGCIEPRVLEPCAGGGSLVAAVIEARPDALVDAYEIDPRWVAHLRQRFAGHDLLVLHEDFVTASGPKGQRVYSLR